MHINCSTVSIRQEPLCAHQLVGALERKNLQLVLLLAKQPEALGILRKQLSQSSSTSRLFLVTMHKERWQVEFSPARNQASFHHRSAQTSTNRKFGSSFPV